MLEAIRTPTKKGCVDMNDNYLVCMAALIVVSYFIYMFIGPGGDGVIFASVVGAVCVLTGVKYERMKARNYIPGDEETEANVDQELP